jgi:hypothetical protein
MTPARLAEIRVCDARTPVNVDRYGGSWMFAKDAAIHGRSACVHRRELLKYVAELELDRAARSVKEPA